MPRIASLLLEHASRGARWGKACGRLVYVEPRENRHQQAPRAWNVERFVPSTPRRLAAWRAVKPDEQLAAGAVYRLRYRMSSIPLSSVLASKVLRSAPKELDIG